MKQAQQGSGGAENTGRGREEQVNRSSEELRGGSDMQEAGIRKQDVSSIEELGGRSGRDDLSGGSNDGMPEQSSGEETDR
ncbi:hypothetical protein [Flaviaesturariibacter amylovorans]|uniref:Stress-induced protein n=1 Tax=Flaviaesturariibacter amylovorans TaxID=1084520 RepID=A0ABP8G5E8_9BACT